MFIVVPLLISLSLVGAFVSPVIARDMPFRQPGRGFLGSFQQRIEVTTLFQSIRICF
jgi:hypothetical protein